MTEGQDNTIPLRVFLLNKRKRYEWQIRQGGKDGRLEEIESLMESIKKSKNELFERRKKIDGFDFAYSEGKIGSLLAECFDNYILGKYYSTIATCSMAAERLCYDYFDFLEIKFGNKILTEKDKEELTYIPFNRMLNLLRAINVLDEKSLSMLHQINEIRNRHLHPKMKDAERDASKIVNLLCHLLDSRLNMFRFYDLVDGKWIRKQNVYFDSND